MLEQCQRKELGWKIPFQVYYGQENNKILRAPLPRNEEIDICQVKPGKKRYNYFVKKTNKIRRKELETSKRFDEGSVKRYERLSKPSMYLPGETVLLRL